MNTLREHFKFSNQIPNAWLRLGLSIVFQPQIHTYYVRVYQK